MSPFLRILLAVLLLPVAAAAQDDTLLFVEPGISLRYNPAHFQVLRYYGHPGDKASYDLLYSADTSRRVELHIESKRPDRPGSMALLDSLLGIQAMEMKDDSVIRILARDTAARHLAGFSCLRFVMFNRDNGDTATALVAAHLGADDYTLVYYTAKGDRGVAADDAVLAALLGRFQSYSEEALAAEATALQKRYTVLLRRDRDCAADPMGKAAWCGTVTVQQPLAHLVVGAEVGTSVRNLFTSTDGRSVRVRSNNRKKGPVSEQGVLVVAAPSGNRVKLPFSIRFTNP
ncbi:hypothetical protein [Flaviaesturariibacter aridisoli]|uniref:Uncharacterized protein n=1 Tax=Flaviaesturariibacter aridisoli TaxID=2545761 RepID=A0A4R4E4M4_9BACT|nr:hypothetical protein [Flaviaesturariibacter aridisoli]TCZ72170.1 hypothetical protein E0486_08750 [Flaviaesturariibacter aridisoli]